MNEMHRDIHTSETEFVSKLSDFHFEFQTQESATSIYLNGKLVDGVDGGDCFSTSGLNDRNDLMERSNFEEDGFDAFNLGSFDTMPDHTRPDEYDFVADHTLAAFQSKKCEKVQEDTAGKEEETQNFVAAEVPEHIEDLQQADV